MAVSMATSESVATFGNKPTRAASAEKQAGRDSHRPRRPADAHLVAQPAAPAVNHDADLADAVDAHLVGRPCVENLVNDLGGARCASASREAYGRPLQRAWISA